MKTTFLGAGSNTLFRDGGVKGVVIKLGKNFSYVNLLSDNVIEAGAATLDRQVADFAKGNSLSNFEFLSCIPGSIGGAIIMNTGCYDNDISKILISVKAIDKNSCKEIEINKKDIKFIYRGNNLSKDLIVISAKFKGAKKRELINQKQIEYANKKSRPSLAKSKLVAVPLKI